MYAEGERPPLSVWHVAGRKKAARAGALAAGVRRMLLQPGDWPIVPKDSSSSRPVRGGDVAVLCRTGDTCREVAYALEAAGVEVALGREGLLESAECTLALACLSWLADPSDTLALAEIAHLSEEGAAGDQPQWFATVLGGRDGLDHLRTAAIPTALQELRPALLSMTPSEALDAVIAAAGIVGRTASWGGTSRRLTYLDALRVLARDYEEDRRQSRKPATAGGLVDWLKESDAEKPASDGGQAVVISTYHGAKGLEWPVTILFELDTVGRSRLFDQVVAEGAPGGVDLDDPLAGRWLRLWPWPYGAQAKDVGLDIRAGQSDVGQTATRQAAAEDVRLLYVAMTRARDYLVLAVDQLKSGSRSAALEALVHGNGASLVKLPQAEGDPLTAGIGTHACRVWCLVEEPVDVAGAPRQRTYDAVPLPRGTVVVHPPYRFRPSDAESESEGRTSDRILLRRLASPVRPTWRRLATRCRSLRLIPSLEAGRGETRRESHGTLEHRRALAPSDVVARPIDSRPSSAKSGRARRPSNGRSQGVSSHSGSGPH